VILIANQTAAHLGGGGSIDIPIIRIIVAFLICIVIALLAILFVRQRAGQGALPDWLRRVAPGKGQIEIVEVRRISLHADIGLLRHQDREYLVLLQAGSSTVLRERDVQSEESLP
jgi:hypothetical protein